MISERKKILYLLNHFVTRIVGGRLTRSIYTLLWQVWVPTLVKVCLYKIIIFISYYIYLVLFTPRKFLSCSLSKKNIVVFKYPDTGQLPDIRFISYVYAYVYIYMCIYIKGDKNEVCIWHCLFYRRSRHNWSKYRFYIKLIYYFYVNIFLERTIFLSQTH